MQKKYSISVNSRTPKPRSQRLRSLGMAADGGSRASQPGSTVTFSSSSAQTGDGHVHSNLASLNKISVDADGYEWITRVSTSDSGEYETVTHKVKAGYADMAHDLDEDSPAADRFISRLKDDVAKGNITFEQAIDVVGKAIVRQALSVLGGASVEGDITAGGNITAEGDITAGGNITAEGDVEAKGSATIAGDSHVLGKAEVGKTASIGGSLNVGGDATVKGDFTVDTGDTVLRGRAQAVQGVDIGTDGAAQIDKYGAANLLSAVVRGFLSSPSFRSGFTGEGWRLALQEGLASLEVDDLTVRRTMRVFELIIEKVRSVGGQICVSAANGKVKEVMELTSAYRLFFEGDNQFCEGDLVRCQVFSGQELRGYWVEVTEAMDDHIDIPKAEFNGWTEPRVGDELVLMGNTHNTLRQSLVLVSATEDGLPRIEVLDGVARKSFEGCLRGRFGTLDDIRDERFPQDGQPSGHGLYSDNAFLRGTFLLTTGEDVRTRFEVTEGRFSSAIESARADAIPESCITYNPTFANDMDGWTPAAAPATLLAAGNFIWAQGNVLSRSGSAFAALVSDGGRTVLRLDNTSVTQTNDRFVNKETFEANADGLYVPRQYTLSILARALRTTQIRVQMTGQDKTGFEAYTTLNKQQTIMPDESYRYLRFSFAWNGTGDLRITSSGGILIAAVTLLPNEAESLRYRHRTLLEQTDKLVRIAAENFDEDGNVLESSSIVTTAEANTLLSQRFNEDGTLINTSGLVTTASFSSLFAQAAQNDTDLVKRAEISVFISEDDAKNLISNATITANQIKLEGYISANSKFQVREDGYVYIDDCFISGCIRYSTLWLGSACTNPDKLDYQLYQANIFSVKQINLIMPQTDVMAKAGRSYKFVNICPTSYDPISISLNKIGTYFNGSYDEDVYEKVLLYPQQTVEITAVYSECTPLGSAAMADRPTAAKWMVTSRSYPFSLTGPGAPLPSPQMVGMGELHLSSGMSSIEGYAYDGRALSDIYDVTFTEGTNVNTLKLATKEGVGKQFSAVTLIPVGNYKSITSTSKWEIRIDKETTSADLRLLILGDNWYLRGDETLNGDLYARWL